jgi:activating signal cointegrator 1
MKALTLWQPWASLLAFGEKRVETRSWSTRYRGLVAIHAAAKETVVYSDWRVRPQFTKLICEITERHSWGDGYWPNSHHRVGFGAVLATAMLVAIEPTEIVRNDLSEQERVFGNYEDGRYAWFFEGIERFTIPVPAKGNRMLWNWNGCAQ